MRWCRRSFSNTRASPTMTRHIPGFFSPNCKSTVTICAAFWAPSPSLSAIWLINVKTACSIKSIKPSNIWALLAKWRYKAASLTPSLEANNAVVTRSAPGCSSICASVCKICVRRSPGFIRWRFEVSASNAEVAPLAACWLDDGSCASDISSARGASRES